MKRHFWKMLASNVTFECYVHISTLKTTPLLLSQHDHSLVQLGMPDDQQSEVHPFLFLKKEVLASTIKEIAQRQNQLVAFIKSTEEYQLSSSKGLDFNFNRRDKKSRIIEEFFTTYNGGRQLSYYFESGPLLNTLGIYEDEQRENSERELVLYEKASVWFYHSDEEQNDDLAKFDITRPDTYIEINTNTDPVIKKVLDKVLELDPYLDKGDPA